MTSAIIARLTRVSAVWLTSTNLLREPIARGLHVILDMVMNHTSDQHSLV